MSVSIEEKSVWIQLASMVFVLGGYFAYAGSMMARGVTEMAAYVAPFIVAVVLMVIVLAAGHAVAAIVRKPEDRDERDKLIAWRSESNASWVLGAGAFFAVVGLVFDIENVWTMQILLFSMFLSEVVKYAYQLVYYRRGV